MQNVIAKTAYIMVSKGMDALSQLERKVEQLLARLLEFQAENIRLTSELAAARDSNADLLNENRNLQASLARNESVRREAMERIKALMSKIAQLTKQPKGL